MLYRAGGYPKSQIPVVKRLCTILHKCSICAKVKIGNFEFRKNRNIYRKYFERKIFLFRFATGIWT